MWKKHFEDEDIFFITPDVRRGLGFAGILSSYHIICTDFDPIIPILRKQGAKIFCLAEKSIDTSKIRNSAKLLENQIVLDYIKENSQVKPKIMYFKPSLKLDILIEKYGFFSIGNKVSTNELFEDKVKFYELFLKELSDYLIPAKIGALGKLNYTDLADNFGPIFVVQFGHGWAGKTTFIVKNEKEFTGLREKFAFTNVKIGRFVEGFTVLNNCCIYQNEVLIGPPAIQIDGISKLSDKPTVTCGRQWPARFIDNDQVKNIHSISKTIGNLMKRNGYGGFFGIDFLVEEKTGKIYISEVNPRLTASSAFFTLMEIGIGNIPFLAYHLAEFLGKALPKNKAISNFSASQIILRKPFNQFFWREKLFGVYKNTNKKPIFLREEYYPAKLNLSEYIFMTKTREKENAEDEYARIETKSEILDKPGKLKEWLEDII